MSLRLHERGAETRRCAWCHDALAAPSPCPDCGTALHAGCWLEAGTCPTLGCSHRPARRALREPRPPVTIRHPLSRSLPALSVLWLVPIPPLLLAVLLYELPSIDLRLGLLAGVAVAILPLIIHNLTRPQLRLDDEAIARSAVFRSAAVPRARVSSVDFTSANAIGRPTLTIRAGRSRFVIDSSAPGFAEVCRRVFESVETQGDEATTGFRDLRLVRAYAALPELGEAVPTLGRSTIWPLLLVPAGLPSLFAVLSLVRNPVSALIALAVALPFLLWLFYELQYRSEPSSVSVSDDTLNTLQGRLLLAELTDVTPRPALTGSRASVTFVGPDRSRALRPPGAPRPARRIVVEGEDEHLRRLLHLVREARQRLGAPSLPSAMTGPLKLRVSPRTVEPAPSPASVAE